MFWTILHTENKIDGLHSPWGLHCRGRDTVNPNESQAVGNRGFDGSWEGKGTETNQVSDRREWELGQDNCWRAGRLAGGTEGECVEERVTVMWSCDPRTESLKQRDILGLK